MNIISSIELTSGFEVDPTFFVFQIINLLFVVAYIYLLTKSIVTIVRKGHGVEVPLWIIAVFLAPIIGSISAIIYYRSKPLKSK